MNGLSPSVLSLTSSPQLISKDSNWDSLIQNARVPGSCAFWVTCNSSSLLMALDTCWRSKASVSPFAAVSVKNTWMWNLILDRGLKYVLQYEKTHYMMNAGNQFWASQSHWSLVQLLCQKNQTGVYELCSFLCGEHSIDAVNVIMTLELFSKSLGPVKWVYMMWHAYWRNLRIICECI